MMKGGNPMNLFKLLFIIEVLGVLASAVKLCMH